MQGCRVMTPSFRLLGRCVGTPRPIRFHRHAVTTLCRKTCEVSQPPHDNQQIACPLQAFDWRIQEAFHVFVGHGADERLPISVTNAADEYVEALAQRPLKRMRRKSNPPPERFVGKRLWKEYVAQTANLFMVRVLAAFRISMLRARAPNTSRG